MDTWNNGDSGLKVKQVVDGNFRELSTRLLNFQTGHIKDFDVGDWINNKIVIGRLDGSRFPIVNLYIKSGEVYEEVFGGFDITDRGIEIISDMPYEGRVVIR